MTTPLQLAQEDWIFQYILATLFGQQCQVNNNGQTVMGFLWRGDVYFTEVS
jgi:hypothetical protein